MQTTEIKEKRTDLDDGYMVTETGVYYILMTPASTQVWPQEKFRSLISHFAHDAFRSPGENET